jgi:Lambda phage tail tube protein, TTP
MANTQATLGYGTLLQRGGLTAPDTFVTVAEVRNIDGPKLTKDFKEVTHMESPGGFKEYIGALKDGGTVTFTCNFLPADGTQDHLTGLIYDFKNNIKRYWREQWPTTPASTVTYLGEVQDLDPKMPVDDAMTLDVTIKISGDPAFA